MITNGSNIMKHAFAKALSVTIQKEKKSVSITIQDNGKGFDLSEKQKNHSLGLKTMEERIRILAGILVIESQPKKGTQISAQIPYSYAKN